MLIHCGWHISVKREVFFLFAVLLQLFLGTFTLLSLRRQIVNKYAKFRYHDEFNEKLRIESDRHVKELFSEISKIDYHIPFCNRNQLSNDFCALFQNAFHESSFIPDNLPAIYSGIFGSCLGLVKRLLDNTKEESWNLRKILNKPFDLKSSKFPYINLGDFVFSADRQWIPTGCKNATKVAVLVLSNTWGALPWKHSFLWRIIDSLQRITVHFGIFVIDNDLNKTFPINKSHITQLMTEWDYVVSFTIKEKDHHIGCMTNDMKKEDVLSARHISYRYKDVTPVAETTIDDGHAPWRLRQPLFTKIAMSSIVTRANEKKRSGLRHKTWRLSNLKMYSNLNENDMQVSKSKVVPSDLMSNE